MCCAAEWAVECSGHPYTSEKDIFHSKETYSTRKRPAKETCKRDLLKSKETYKTCAAPPNTRRSDVGNVMWALWCGHCDVGIVMWATSINSGHPCTLERDLFQSKETCERDLRKRPAKETYERDIHVCGCHTWIPICIAGLFWCRSLFVVKCRFTSVFLLDIDTHLYVSHTCVRLFRSM